MKKTLLIVASVVGASLASYGQGTINWNENTGWTPGFYSPNPASPSVEQTGYSQQDVPQGGQSYGGGWLGGTSSSPGTGVGGTPSSGPGGFNYQTAANFTVGLYLDTSLTALTADIASGTPVATRGINPSIAGTYNSSSSTTSDPNIAGGTSVYVGLAAWYNAGNTIDSYAAAVSGNDPAGYNEGSSTLALSSGNASPVTITTATGPSSFSLVTATPEPSTIALGMMGASALLMRLRRK